MPNLTSLLCVYVKLVFSFSWLKSIFLKSSLLINYYVACTIHKKNWTGFVKSANWGVLLASGHLIWPLLRIEKNEKYLPKKHTLNKILQRARNFINLRYLLTLFLMLVSIFLSFNFNNYWSYLISKGWLIHVAYSYFC